MHLSERSRDRDDVVSVCSARSTPSFSLRLRHKSALHFRDDLSEYSHPSNWGDWKGPLSISDYKLHHDGLQARRTVGEAILRAQHLRHTDSETCMRHCQCFRPRPTLRLRKYLGSWNRIRRVPSHSQTLFLWAEVQSVVLVPTDELRGPCLLAVSTFRREREEGTREWLLQAGSFRGRACWSLELVASLLRHHCSERGSSPCICNANVRPFGLSMPLFMDMSRIACEVGRLRPSTDSMETLMEVLDMLADGRRPGDEAPVLSAPPHLPVAALRRFREAVRRAHSDFLDWLRWREVVLYVRAPAALEDTLWHRHVLPFIQPRELMQLEDLSHEKLCLKKYPDFVEAPLTSAAERCRRTLSS
mmetsp:Transcript_835/g.2453  ORF Transcript_835/g.2453 Transcript_835/m.2453 type:complete len:360 (-) Transcript_835:174-1253(-)